MYLSSREILSNFSKLNIFVSLKILRARETCKTEGDIALPLVAIKINWSKGMDEIKSTTNHPFR